MFTGVEKNDKNKRTLTALENSVIEKKLDRFILFGNETNELTRLSQDFLTALNVQGYITIYLHVEELIDNKSITPSYHYRKSSDIIVLDGLFNTFNLTTVQKEEIHNFLSASQHDYIFLTCPLTPEEVFSEKVRNYFDNGVTWSRNFLGCRQLFMEDANRLKFREFLKKEPKGDYRIIQSIEFLEKEVIPYYELSFITKEDIRRLLEDGDDYKHNCLIITTEPKVKLISLEDRQHYRIAVRLEAFMAGNNYVGRKINNTEVNSYYRLLLEGYYHYLENEREIFMDTGFDVSMTNKELVTEIKHRMKNYKKHG